MTTQDPDNPTEPGQAKDDGYHEMEGGTSLSNILNKLLREPMSLVYYLENSKGETRLTGKLLIITTISLAIFGFVVGSFSAGDQLWAAPVKIIFGVFFSGLICLPSLYIFACLGGLDAKFRTVSGALFALLALTSLLLVGFAPVVWLFSTSSNSFGFMGFLLIALWLICVGFGFRVLCRATSALGMSGSGHLFIWCLVFLLVTLQMTTTLRPILGSSDRFLNLEEKRFFLTHWGRSMDDEYFYEIERGGGQRSQEDRQQER